MEELGFARPDAALKLPTTGMDLDGTWDFKKGLGLQIKPNSLNLKLSLRLNELGLI